VSSVIKIFMPKSIIQIILTELYLCYKLKSFKGKKTVHTILHSVAELYVASRNEESGHELLVQYLRCWLLDL
jgi:hypothetical protein